MIRISLKITHSHYESTGQKKRPDIPTEQKKKAEMPIGKKVQTEIKKMSAPAQFLTFRNGLPGNEVYLCARLQTDQAHL